MDVKGFLKTHRRRIARLIAIVAIAVLGSHFFSTIPRDVELRYDLGPDHDRWTAVEVSYQMDGGEVAGVRWLHRRGAPRSIRHTVSLAPGRYEVVAILSAGSRRQTVERAIQVPADSVIRIDLFDLEYASVIQP